MATTEYEAVPSVAREGAETHLGTIVVKFGGTSVAGPERLKAVAQRIVAAREAGSRVVGVLSAMGDTTDELIDLAHQVSARPKPRALDMLISVGERISCALAEMAIEDLGHRAISLTGSQAGIVTDTTHGKAKIVDVRAQRIHEALDDDMIVLVAGFQGVSTDLEITTLGRGGSDMTAVALAAALGADACEIYTDVEGVFTADPRIVPEARKLDAVSYEEMLEMSATGARVLQLRSVEFARNHGVTLHVRSTFSDAEGTWIRQEDEEMLEKAIISGVTHDTAEAKVTILGVPDRPGVAATVFRALADAGVNVDMIVQNVSERGHTDISFTLPAADLRVAEPILEKTSAEVGAAGFTQDADIAKVSLVGAGMRSHPGVAAEMFSALAEAGINIEIISTSSIRISCCVRAGDVERAVRAIHDRFGLSEPAGARTASGA
jgi:aspartate kinase